MECGGSTPLCRCRCRSWRVVPHIPVPLNCTTSPTARPSDVKLPFFPNGAAVEPAERQSGVEPPHSIFAAYAANDVELMILRCVPCAEHDLGRGQQRQTFAAITVVHGAAGGRCV